jgi:hypothetical protein
MVLIAPLAMLFTPYEGMFTGEKWHGSLDMDSLYHLRVGLIIGGMVGAVMSVGLLLVDMVKRFNVVLEPRVGTDLVLQMSMAICSLSLGWAAFPYRINGVFQGYSGNAPVPYTYLYDPKHLMPMIWIGEVWRVGVLGIMLSVVFGGPILFLASLGLSFVTKSWKKGLATAICLAISAAVFLWSSDYLNWLGIEGRHTEAV